MSPFTCPICTSANVENLDIPFPFFAHLDYKTMRAAGTIQRCRMCQALAQQVADGDVVKITQLLRSESYAQSRQTSQTFVVNEFDHPVTRSYLQAEILCSRVTAQRPSILDIGCHDGQLLREMGTRLVDATLHGFDLNQNLRTMFPSEKNFVWWSDLDAIDGKFDVIAMSHMMMYERDIRHLLNRAGELLKRDGLLFIQGPDISSSPCHILLGDQYYYYTGRILLNTLRRFGLAGELLKTTWFPRELVCLARPRAEPTECDEVDLQIHDCVLNLDSKKAALCGFDEDSIAVLGTTVNAAFVDSIIGDRVHYFVDENPTRVGTRFRGKEVRHPRVLGDDDFLVIPYGVSGDSIRARLESQYAGQFAVI